MTALQRSVSRYAVNSLHLTSHATNFNASSQHRFLHISSASLQATPSPATTATPASTPASSPPLPIHAADVNAKSASGGTFHKARQWLRQQPPALRYTIVGVVAVLGTLESSFWLYNGYLRVRQHQTDRQREKEDEAAEAATEVAKQSV